MEVQEEKDVELKEEIDLVESQEEEYEKKQHKKKKRNIILIVLGIILLICLIFSVIFAFINNSNENIISGVTVNGIDISGLSREEVKQKLTQIVEEKNNKEIILKYNDYETAISPELIEVKYNIDEVVNECYNIGRDSNIFVNNYSILFTMLGQKNVNISVTYNKEQLEKIIQDNNSKLPGAIKESSYYVEDDNLIITKGQKGIAIDSEKTIEQIEMLLQDINNKNENYIDLNIIEQEPKPIDMDKIYEEVHTEAKDAYYSKDPFQIYPEVNGVDFDLNAAKNMLNEDKNEYTIKLTITKPKVTVDQIGTEAFPDRLAIFTTRYNAGDTNRTTNLRLACQKINGKVLLADETFSYNKTLGERTIAAGYKEAKIYSAGQVIDGLGGGICQISSTLYNAAVMANLQIVERRNHQFVTSYLPAGRDATVVYGATDFKFKNTRKYPIRIMANVKNGIATVEIYGIKEDEYEVTFDTRTVGTIPFSTKYIDDDSLEAGKEVVTQKGANGLQTETYVIKSQNGKVVSRSLLSKDTYTPMQRIIKKSTKSVESNKTVQPTLEVKKEAEVEKKDSEIIKEQSKETNQKGTNTDEKGNGSNNSNKDDKTTVETSTSNEKSTTNNTVVKNNTAKQ